MNKVVSLKRANRLKEIRDGLELSYDSIDAQSASYDWTEGYAERWDTIQPDFSDIELVKKFLDMQGHEHKDQGASETDEEYERRSTEQAEEVWRTDEFGHPMMNYYYPFHLRHGADPSELQMKMFIEGGSTCLVMVEEEPVIALTGGGMDLSWDICLAYILCGNFPPVRFCDLPDFAGQKSSETNLLIIAACQESCQGLKERAERAGSRLDAILANLGDERK